MESVEHSVKHLFFKNQIIAALLLVVFGWFIIQIREILILFFISYIIMAALKPYVNFLIQYKIPRSIAVAILYIATLAIVILLVVPLIPFFATQFSSLIVSFPKYLDSILSALKINISASQMQQVITSQLGTLSSNAFAVTGAILGSIFSLFLVFVVSFYLMMDEKRLKKDLSVLFPAKDREKTLAIAQQVEDKLGAWFRGQLVLCLAIGLLTWIALSIIGFPFALPLALLAGILEIIPTIGPILSAVPAVVVALSISPGLTFLIIILYVVIQVLENNILVPKVMQRAVGLNPIVIILAITIGAQLLGVLGALLSIPFISMLIIIIKNIRKD